MSGTPLPTACLDLDLVPDLTGRDPLAGVDLGPGGAVVLLRVHGEPLASVRLAPGSDTSRESLLARLDLRARARVTAHLVADGVAAASLRTDADTVTALDQVAGAACFSAPARSGGLVSVVVCTLGREPLLRTCLERLAAQDHSEVEIVVVDNDPASGLTAAVVEAVGHPRVRLVEEPRRGLSFARNAGIAAASGRLVAFTDDDAVPDLDWVSTLASTFCAAPEIDAVTGLVVPLELDTPAQHWFEEFGSFDKGYQRWVWHVCESRHDFDELGAHGNGGPAFPFAAGVVGSGNNMAFRRETLERIGGFDVALGAGTPAGGGEDLDAYVSILLSGGVIVYEPRAVVRHRHRREVDALGKQAYAYGSGLSAMLAKQVLASPARATGVAVRIPAGLKRLLDPESAKNARKTGDFPPSLTRTERRGFAAGPLLYLKGRRAARGTVGEVGVVSSVGGRPPRTAVAAVDLETIDVPSTLESAGLDGDGAHDAAWVLVREQGRPRAMVETPLPPEGDLAERLREVVTGQPEVRPVDRAAAEAISVSVVVPTVVGRHEDLAACLDSLRALSHSRLEIVLVDNRPEIPADDPLPAILAERPGVRVVHQPVRGISAARNAGVAVATGDVVAFTDDDVRVDAGWASALAARFAAHPDELAVTGLILPAELETPSQIWFERYYGGFGGERSFVPLSYGVEAGSRPWQRATIVSRDESGARVSTHPVYGAGVCGAGANMAFRRSWLLENGGFDQALGTGTASRGGEDLAAVISVLWSGGRVGYEPAAVVRHRHRESYDELRTQMRGYGVGYTAMLTSLVVNDPTHVVGLAAQLPAAVVRHTRGAAVRLSGRRPTDTARESDAPAYPADLARLELSGYPRGPFAYAASRRAARATEQSGRKRER